MVKHTQAIRQQQPTDVWVCLNFCGVDALRVKQVLVNTVGLVFTRVCSYEFDSLTIKPI